MNSRCRKLYRTCSVSFNSSNVGKFFYSWILRTIKVQEKKRKLLSWVPVSDETWNKALPRRSRDVQSCCFANLNLLPLCRSRCCRRRRCLSSLLANFPLCSKSQKSSRKLTRPSFLTRFWSGEWRRCYPSRPKSRRAEGPKDRRTEGPGGDLHNSSYQAKAYFNNYLVIHSE